MLEELIRRLKKESDFYYIWQSNIAMAFHDECKRNSVKISHEKLYEVSNNAAKNFLNLLIEYMIDFSN